MALTQMGTMHKSVSQEGCRGQEAHALPSAPRTSLLVCLTGTWELKLPSRAEKKTKTKVKNKTHLTLDKCSKNTFLLM